MFVRDSNTSLLVMAIVGICLILGILKIDIPKQEADNTPSEIVEPAWVSQLLAAQLSAQNNTTIQDETQGITKEYLTNLIKEALNDINIDNKVESDEPVVTSDSESIKNISLQITKTKTKDEVVNNMMYVRPIDAVPGDVFITNGYAYTLLCDGITLPFGNNPIEFIMDLKNKPDLAIFISPVNIQAGDIFILKDQVYTLLDGGWALVYKDSAASEILQMTDLLGVSIVVRMSAGNVPINTTNLLDAATVLRIRPDVEKKEPLIVE